MSVNITLSITKNIFMMQQSEYKAQHQITLTEKRQEISVWTLCHTNTEISVQIQKYQMLYYK